jgi:hypothetical protein
VKDHQTDLTLPRTTAARHLSALPDAPPQTPTTAPRRTGIDRFCAQSRPWALRQAARTYRHLPEDLREQAVDLALAGLQAGAATEADRRELQRALATALTESLRGVHVSWCLTESETRWRQEGDGVPPAPTAPAPEQLAGFVERGLNGLERAVLQLEIGAGRDSRTVRAALRLTPREYGRHRAAGLSKLRDAITGQVAGRVCDHHLDAVVHAATGDPGAGELLAAGPDRCRSCSREAQGLRRLLHQRLALAPWPLAIKPAGLLAGKLAALGAAVGGRSVLASGVAAAPAGSGAGALTAVLATAVVATGGVVALGHDGTPARAAHPVAAAPHVAAQVVPAASTTAPAQPPHRAAHRHRAAAVKPKAKAPRVHHRHAAPAVHRHGSAPAAPAHTAPAATTVGSPAPTAVAPAAVLPAAAKPVGQTVTKVTDQAKNVVDQTLPAPVAAPVDQAVDTVQQTVQQTLDTTQQVVDQTAGQALNQVGSAVGGLVQPHG